MCANNNFNKYTLIDFEQDFSVLLMHVCTIPIHKFQGILQKCQLIIT